MCSWFYCEVKGLSEGCRDWEVFTSGLPNHLSPGGGGGGGEGLCPPVLTCQKYL